MTPYKMPEETTRQIKGTFDLGGGLRVQVLVSNGRPLIDIRRWTTRDMPSQKGIALSPLSWVTLLRLRHRVFETMKDIKAGMSIDERMHVSGPIFLSMISPYNLHRWFKCEQGELATKKGIMLRFPELENLFSLEEALYNCMPELREVMPCVMREDQYFPRGEILHCQDCQPFGYNY